MYGDPDGIPVLNCHGGLVCRIDVEPNVADFEALRARVISPDRPGVGRSDRSPGRVTADFADDVARVARRARDRSLCGDGLVLRGQYAAAIAARLPDRVQRIAIIAGCLPLDDPDTFAHLNTMDRRFTWLSRHARPIARLQLRCVLAVCEPSATASHRLGGEEAAHARRCHAPRPWRLVRAHGGRGHAQRSGSGRRLPRRGRALGLRARRAAPWRRTSTRAPRTRWCHRSGPTSSRRRIPDARLTTYKGEGHMIAVSHRGDVVRDLLA